MAALPTLRQLRYLVALDDFRHFGRAAEACAATQSTLSAGLQELEATLGATLVERTKRRVLMTPLGADVVARARRVYTHGEYYLGYFATELGETLAAAHKSAEARALLTESVTRLTQSLGAADPHTQHARALLSQLDNSVLALTPARADAAGK